jgi:hypothetical protein
MPFNPIGPLLDELNKLASNPQAFKERPSWQALQKPGSVMEVVSQFRENLGASEDEVQHISEHISPELAEKIEEARRYFVERIANDQPIRFEMEVVEGDEHHITCADGVIRLELAAVPA